MGLINTFIDAYRSKIHKKLVSRINSCTQHSKKHSTLYVRANWKEEAITLTEEEWLNLCQINPSTTSSGQWGEF